MNPAVRSLLTAALLALPAGTALAQTTQPFSSGKVQTIPIPKEFTDPETHPPIVHLSRFPGDYAGVDYFTYNPFSADSRLAFIDTQFKDKWRHLYTFDFASMSVAPLVTDLLTPKLDRFHQIRPRLFSGRQRRLGGPADGWPAAQTLRSSGALGSRVSVSR